MVKQAILDALDDDRLRIIDFSMDGSGINRSRFSRIRDAIDNGNIDVIEDTSLPAGAAASYNDDANVIGHEPGLTANDVSSSVATRAVIMHECAHAIVDMNQQSLRVLADEAAGYIVQIMYRLIAGQSFIRTWAEQNKTTPDGRIYYEAIRVVDARSMIGHCVILRSEDHCEKLMKAVQEHPVYAGTRMDAYSRCNGI
ncbi:hypothetical protein ABVF61_03620 [Roseibium sp. HPY-6]|uniref:hypothetical protein n=1 Tax=Roseibium sp. HPY-6 TaxID=3229852 RepID=UPI00338E415D